MCLEIFINRSSVVMVICRLILIPVVIAEEDIEIPEGARLGTFISTEHNTHHMELDKFVSGNLLLAEGAKLTTTDGETLQLVSGSEFIENNTYVEGIGSGAKYSHMISFIQLSTSHVLVIDRWNHCLRLVDRFSRQSSHFAGNCTRGPAYRNGVSPLFYQPWSAIRDNRDGDKLLLTEHGSGAVRTINVKTVRVETLIKDDSLSRPRELTQEKISGDLYIVILHGVMKYTNSDGSLRLLAGSLVQGLLDGPLLEARFNHPNSIEMLSPEKLLLTDYDNNMLRTIDLDADTSGSICSGGRDSINGGLETCQIDGPTTLLRVNDTVVLIGTKRMIRTLQVSLIEENQISHNSTVMPDSTVITRVSLIEDHQMSLNTTLMTDSTVVTTTENHDNMIVVISLSVTAGVLVLLFIIVLIIVSIRWKRRKAVMGKILAPELRAFPAPRQERQVTSGETTLTTPKSIQPCPVPAPRQESNTNGIYLESCGSKPGEDDRYADCIDPYYTDIVDEESITYEAPINNYVENSYYTRLA